MSPGLWVQMLGRGTRPYYLLNGANPSILDTLEGRFWAMQNGGKRDCLVLDFAGNTLRLGPINDPAIPEKKGGGRGAPPVKICKTERLKIDKLTGQRPEGCGCYNHTMNKNCDMCGNEFDFSVKITSDASLQELIATDNATPDIKWFDIDVIQYSTHTGPSGKQALKATYWSGKKKFMDFIFMGETGQANFLGHRARGWWETRWKGNADEPGAMPESVGQASLYASAYYLKEPRKIQVLMKGKDGYPEIMSYEYE
jgi:DNA repair protein RadD